jgi:hypothetical protein
MAIGGSITSATAGSVLFAGAAGVLTQDNTNFFWDDALNDLHIGGTYYIKTFKGLYQVPNASGDNWFEGDAGNLTLTGYQNFGTGGGCLSRVTTGYGNTGVGATALQYLTTGHGNFAFGTGAANALTVGNDNVVVGPLSLTNGSFVNSNVALGSACMRGLGSGGAAAFGNIGIGLNALSNLDSGNGNVGIGWECATNSSGSTAQNTFVGNQVFSNASGTSTYNTMVGAGAGFFIANGNGNTILGRWFGPSATINNVIALAYGSGGSSLAADFGYSNSGWTFVGTTKAGAPAAGDLPASCFAVIDDTSGGATWLVFNKAGTIRKVQLV